MPRKLLKRQALRGFFIIFASCSNLKFNGYA